MLLVTAEVLLIFWSALLAMASALNLLFTSTDLFNLYVALELLTFAAVPLACVDGRAETYAAALRYLLFALFGSIFYLLGAALLYGAFGTLDIRLLAERIRPMPAVTTAAALMTAGMRLTSLEEHDTVPWNALGDAMEEVDVGEFRLREVPERLPASYTLQAVKPSEVSSQS